MKIFALLVIICLSAFGQQPYQLNGAGSASGFPAYYGNFYDSTNQTISDITQSYVLKIGSNYNTNSGISIQQPGNKITFSQSGTYIINFSLQFQNTATASGNYNADVWFRKNNTDIEYSNSIFTIPNKSGSVNGALIGASFLMVTVNANDYIQIVWAGSTTSVSIATLAAQSNPTVPITPGVIVGVYAIH